MTLVSIALVLAQYQGVSLPPAIIQNKRECGALVRLPISAPPAPANTTVVRILISAHFVGETWIENTGAKERAAGMWDIGARFQIGALSKAIRASFNFPTLPGYACHGPNADGEFDGKGVAGRTWTVDHTLVGEILITEPTAVARWHRTANGVHHDLLIIVPELDSSGLIYCRAGVMWWGDVKIDTGSVFVEYQ